MTRNHPAPERAAARRTTGASVLGGGVWTTTGMLVSQVYVLAMSAMAARFLRPDEMGRQSFIAFVALSMVMVLTGGLPAALQRFIGETIGGDRPDHVPDLVSWGWRVAAPAALLSSGILAIVAATGSAPQAAWLLAGGVCALSVMQSVPAAVLAGMQRWRPLSLVGLSTGAVATFGTFAVLAAGGGIVGMFAVELAITALNLVLAIWLAHAALAGPRAHRSASADLRRRAARWASVGTFSILLTLVVWRRSEFFFLAAYSTDAQIAMYSIAFAAVTALTRIPEAAGIVVSPAFATLFGARQLDRMRSGYARAVRMVLLFSLPITAAAIALAGPAVRVVYGGRYEQAAELLALMALSLPIVSLAAVSRALIFGLGRQRVMVMVGIVAATVDLTLAFLLVPRHDAVGAVISSSVAQALAASSYLVYAARAVGGLAWAPGAVARTAAAAAVAGVSASLVARVPPDVVGLAAGIATWGIVFGALAIVFRVLPADDGRWLELTVAGRIGGRPGAMVRRALVAASGGKSVVTVANGGSG